jgi:excisionase family DNA binding protein
VSDESRGRETHDRMTVAEAALILGISKSAVRKRVERGKLDHERTPDGTLLVYLDKSQASRDMSRERPRQSHDVATTERYVRSLEEQVGYLREQLVEEREANRENRRIIAALTSRIPELPPASTERSSEPREPHASAVTNEQAEEALGGPGSGTARGSWWRRMFGG